MRHEHNAMVKMVSRLRRRGIVAAIHLRERLRRWMHQWPEKTVRNDSYTGRGVIVPLREMERVSFRVVSL